MNLHQSQTLQQTVVIANVSQASCNHTYIIFRLTVSEQKRAAEREHANRVRQMFATIAKRYDLLNHLLSGNIDKRWRRLVAKQVREALGPGSSRILDVACGTGDLSLTLLNSLKRK